ncbi:MAG: molybdopterin cofactor-binding domain-containing protein [Gemmatimonadaceae bacterium]
MSTRSSDENRPGRIGRRQFITISAIAGGAAVLVLSPVGRRAARRFARNSTPVDPLAYVAIHPDDTIVVTIPKSEMGQGIRTSLAMLVAEEMDADWDKVRVETAAFDSRYGDQGTSGSLSIAERFTALRQVGATTRAMLIAAAARQLGAPAKELRTERSAVVHAASGRTLGYGALASRLVGTQPPRDVPLKPSRDWRLIGTARPGRDVGDIVRGAATYGIDVRIPGMRFASIERARAFGAAVAAFDAAGALAVPGVVQVVETPGDGPSGVAPGVAVIATNTWAAIEGRRQLSIEWTAGARATESSDSYRTFMHDAVAKAGTEVVQRIGDPDGALARAATVIRSDFEAPFLAHATMEPMNCTASVSGQRAELWSPTQVPDISAREVARALGVPMANVRLHVPLIGGGFGRRINGDYSVEAALLSKQIGAPVQVVWTREDDVRHDFYRPCAVHRFEAAVDANGFPIAWRHRLCTAAIAGTGGRTPSGRVGLAESQGARNATYRVPQRSSEYTLLPSGAPRGSWRSVHSSHAVFAVESFIDELAAAAKHDPVDYRLALIDKPPADEDDPTATFDPDRLKAALRLVAQKASWGAPAAGRAQGVACSYERRSYAAQVVEVVMDRGTPRVARVVVAIDCGPVVNLSGARAQVEGGVTQALSAALGERVTIAGGRVEQGNFDDYRVLRMSEAPPVIEVHFVPRDDVPPTGLGEVAVPTLAPALANAIARATGKRLRSLPLVST